MSERLLSPDPGYYGRREEQERLAAERSADPGARRIHAELANRYADCARDAFTVPATNSGSL